MATYVIMSPKHGEPRDIAGNTEKDHYGLLQRLTPYHHATHVVANKTSKLCPFLKLSALHIQREMRDQRIKNNQSNILHVSQQT